MFEKIMALATIIDAVESSEEREPNEFYGFWTYDSDTVARILSHLRETYPAEDSALTAL